MARDRPPGRRDNPTPRKGKPRGRRDQGPLIVEMGGGTLRGRRRPVGDTKNDVGTATPTYKPPRNDTRNDIQRPRPSSEGRRTGGQLPPYNPGSTPQRNTGGSGRVNTPSPAGPSPTARAQAVAQVARGTSSSAVTPPRVTPGPPRASGSMGSTTGGTTRSAGSFAPRPTQGGRDGAGPRAEARSSGLSGPDNSTAGRAKQMADGIQGNLGSRTGESFQAAQDRLSGRGVRIEKNTSTSGPRAGKSYMVYDDGRGNEVHDYGMGKKYKIKKAR